MAISVDGYGNITQGNAKEIYTAWKRGEVELDKSQQKKCESFLSPQDMDSVEYDTKSAQKTGSSAIDASGAEKHGGQGGNAAGTSVGMVAGAMGAMVLSKQASTSVEASGWVACAFGAAVLACGIATKLFANMFDNGYKDRTAACGAKDGSNQTLDSYTEALENSMEMMNQDVQHYNETQTELTTTVNTQTSQGAELQMQYDTAMAAGDTQGAQQAQEQMKQLKEQDNSALEDDLSETGGAIEEYRAMNAEALGCADSGQTVSDFLKEGTALGVVAGIDAILLGKAKSYTEKALAGSAVCAALEAAKFNFSAVAAALVASALFAVSVSMLDQANGVMKEKTNKELECGDGGKDMQGHVTSLYNAIDEQATYADDTEGQFQESDAAAAESQAGAAAEAGKAVSGNKENVGSGGSEEDKIEQPKVVTPSAGAGGGGGGGGAAA